MSRRGPIAYSAAELQFLADRRTMGRRALHAAFVRAFGRTDVSYDDLKNLCARKQWRVGGRARWTAEEDAQLRALYPDTPTKDIAAQLGRSLTTTYQRAQKLGLEKSEAYLASPAACRLRRGDNVGAASRFKKGHAPANKGLRRPGWAPGRMRESQFKKGQNGWNWKPIGSERVIDGYRYTKVSDERRVSWTVNWKPTHIIRWEAVNGPLPTGHALKSLDGNRQNVDPSNWVAVPRALLPRLNGIRGRGFDQAPAELKPAILAIATLEHARNKADGLTPIERMNKKRLERERAKNPNKRRRRRASSEKIAS